MTFTELQSAVSANVWPEGQARRLRARSIDWLRDALIDLQKKVWQLKAGHVSYFPQEATYYKCYLSAFEAPHRGHVTKLSVRTVGTCCEVPCRPVSKQEMESMTSYCYGGCTAPLPVNTTPSGPFGLMTPDATLDQRWRADIRKASLYNGFVWVWPHIQSTEEIVLEWSGAKNNWRDSDVFAGQWLDEHGEFDREIQRLIELKLSADARFWEACQKGEAAADFGLYERTLAQYIITRRNEESVDNIQPPFFR